MATTRLSNVIVPSVFSRYMSKDTTETTAIFSSGILRQDPSLTGFMAGGGLTIDVPMWLDLADAAPGIANDDPASIATPGNIGTARQTAIRNVRTRGWSAARLTAELAGSDPMARIRERVSAWWGRAFEAHLISQLIGVFADNTANDAGDMQLNISVTSGTPVAANLMSADAIIEGKQTMGDADSSLSLIIMHSRVFSNLQKQNLIDFIPNARGEIDMPTYLGYRVVKSDNCPVTGAGPYVYSTYLIGSGAFVWGESPPAVPVAVENEEAQGNGMGVETLWTRRQYLLHPAGFRWTDSSRAGDFPTDAENQMAANWDRTYPERKQVPLVRILTNG